MQEKYYEDDANIILLTSHEAFRNIHLPIYWMIDELFYTL